MIDSLLFLPDDVDGAAAHVHVDLDPARLAPAAAGSRGREDAEATAAVAATRDGHAHAARGAWDAAGAALERAAAMRDGLVAAGLAGPVVAARGWSDLAAVRAASGDLDAARAAFVRVRTATRGIPDLPADVAAAIAELDAALGATVGDAPQVVTPPPANAATDAPVDAFVGGLLWLDTTEEAAPDAISDGAGEPRGDAPGVAPNPAIDEAPAAVVPTPAPPRITAIDDAVALAHGGRAPASGAGSLISRLRRLLRA